MKERSPNSCLEKNKFKEHTCQAVSSLILPSQIKIIPPQSVTSFEETVGVSVASLVSCSSERGAGGHLVLR